MNPQLRKRELGRIRFAFARLGVVLQPAAVNDERLGVLNPACVRLRDGTLQIYPRMVARGNVSRVGSYSARERADGTLAMEFCGYALEPAAAYERRGEPGGYGCEDPRVTYVAAIDSYVMAYIAFGPRGPEAAVAVSHDGLVWERLGLLRFREDEAPFADKDAAFFPEPVRSPSGEISLALYHRPTLAVSVRRGERAAAALEELPAEKREGIALGYIPLARVQADLRALCVVTETHPLAIPHASWGTIKVGAGTPPVRTADGWLSVIHGVDELPHPSGNALLRYCAGVLIHDPQNIARVVYRSPAPLFEPEAAGEINGTVGYVVFPTGIDPHGEGAFDVYYGMADYAIGRGRLTMG